VIAYSTVIYALHVFSLAPSERTILEPQSCMNDSFIAMLRARTESAAKRVKEARLVAAAAEAELAMWNAALEAELRNSGITATQKGTDDNANGHGARQELSPDSQFYLPPVPDKTDIFRKVLIQVGKPMTAAEIGKAVGDRLSRSYIYYLIGKLRRSHEIDVDGRGRISLRNGAGAP
jgi:hypothetical protein